MLQLATRDIHETTFGEEVQADEQAGQCPEYDGHDGSDSNPERTGAPLTSARTQSPEDRVLIHEPIGTAFDLPTQLAVFHRGWTAGRDADEGDE